ncbi:MAG: peptidoglycan-binding protein, partial [Aeromonas sp.]
GSYTLLWRMPKGHASVIASTAPPAQIQWLDNALNQITQQPMRKVRRFDQELKQKLLKFQQDNGLTADGIAGSHTLLRLNALSGEAMPRLEEAS